MYPARRAADYRNAPAYGYGSTGGGFISYPQPSRGVVGDMWRQPLINDRRDVPYDYAYQESQHKQGRVEFPVIGLRDEIGKLSSEVRTDRNTVPYGRGYEKEYTGSYGRGYEKEYPGSYGRGYEKEYISSGKYGGSSRGNVGSMTGATNDIGTAVELLMDAASGSRTKPSSRIGELESPVNYYPAMHTTMDASKRYGSFNLAPKRSYMGEPAKYY